MTQPSETPATRITEIRVNGRIVSADSVRVGQGDAIDLRVGDDGQARIDVISTDFGVASIDLAAPEDDSA